MATSGEAAGHAPDPSLRDRVVIVTGGSRGMGRAMALALAEAGALVTVTASAATAQLEETRHALEAIAGKGRALALAADVRSVDACRDAVTVTIAEFGAVHALVNNAGLGMRAIRADYPVRPVRFWEASADDCRRVVDVNVTGVFNMTLAVAPNLVTQRFGKIVNVSTSERVLTLSGFFPYGPTKIAVEAASHIWAKELEDVGVDVNIYLPGGATDTEMMPAFPGRETYGGGLMSPTVMAPGILWLCSDQSNGMSGGRYVARHWDASLPASHAAAKARSG